MKDDEDDLVGGNERFVQALKEHPDVLARPCGHGWFGPAAKDGVPYSCHRCSQSVMIVVVDGVRTVRVVGVA